MATGQESQFLLNSIMTAHGGLEAFENLKEIQCTFNFHGGALTVKSYGTKTRQPTITFRPSQDSEPHTIVTNLGDGDATDRWHFTPNRVWIENAQGQILQEALNPRETLFNNHILTTKWEDLHLCYFLSYAMYNYLTIPWLFTRPGFEIKELEPHTEFSNQKEPWRVLQVTHPEGFSTHTRVQTFYFGSKDFLLKRMDYETDVFGGVAAHYVFDYKKIGKLLFPSVRRVVKRMPGTRQSVFGAHTSFWLEYVDLRVVDGEGIVHSEVERVITE